MMPTFADNEELLDQFINNEEPKFFNKEKPCRRKQWKQGGWKEGTRDLGLFPGGWRGRGGLRGSSLVNCIVYPIYCSLYVRYCPPVYSGLPYQRV